MKPSLLMLVHRIPYPPNKGDKVRSFNILRYLSAFYDIHLGAFVDDPCDWQYKDKLTEYCSSVKLIKQNKKYSTLTSLSGFLTGKALTLPYYYDGGMQAWVDQILQQYQPKNIFVYSSSMAQYVMTMPYQANRVMDFVDVDSHKWEQYAEKKPFWVSWIYRRESAKLLSYEIEVSKNFDSVFFVSDAESSFFNKQTRHQFKEKNHYFFNGVDSEFFTPDFAYPESPYDSGKINLVFTGAMDYWPNIDAVVYFTQQVIDKIDDRYHFYIVGGNPTAEVKALASRENVTVTGRVDDIRLYIHYADIAVAPLTIARGIQNKVLEAMAMAKVVVCSEMALEGISAIENRDLLVAHETNDYFNILANHADNDTVTLGTHARQFVQHNFTWDTNLEKLRGRLI